MKNIQEYTTWLKQQLYLYEQAEQNHARFQRYNDAQCCNWSGILLRQCLQKAELLSDKQPTEEPQPHLDKANVVGSGDGFSDEDDEDYDEPEPQCSACCMVGGHMPGCPEDDSPFALLSRRGFD